MITKRLFLDWIEKQIGRVTKYVISFKCKKSKFKNLIEHALSDCNKIKFSYLKQCLITLIKRLVI